MGRHGPKIIGENGQAARIMCKEGAKRERDVEHSREKMPTVTAKDSADGQ